MRKVGSYFWGMRWEAVCIGDAPKPKLAHQWQAELPPRPSKRTVYLVRQPPKRAYPALIYDPARAASQPERYYDPETLSPLQLGLGWYWYKLRRRRLCDLRAKLLQCSLMIHYAAFDESGQVVDYNPLLAEAVQRLVGVSLRRGLPYSDIVRPENLEAFRADFLGAKAGKVIHTQRQVGPRVAEVLMLPLSYQGRRYVGYQAVDVTLYQGLAQSLYERQKLVEAVSEKLQEGIFSINKQGEIIYTNFLAEQFLGLSVGETLPFLRELASEEGLLEWRKRLFRWQLVGQTEANRIYLIADVTRVYQAQQEMLLLRRAWEEGDVGLFVLRAVEGRWMVVYANPAVRQWFPGPLEAMWEAVQAHMKAAERRRLPSILASEEGINCLLTASYYKRGWSHLRLRLKPVLLAPDLGPVGEGFTAILSGRLWLGILQDETRLYQAARRERRIELRQNQLILQAQEQERQRLAEELHDHVGALLSTLRMQMETFWMELPKSYQGTAAGLLARLDEAIRAVRLTSHQLMPPLMEHLGLVATLEALVRRFNAVSTQIRFSFEASGSEHPLPLSRKLHVYRIIQELLVNATRHSGATEGGVRVHFGRKLVIEVWDNGRGYSPQQLVREGIGLQNIGARVRLLGATWQDLSEPNQGARHQFIIPLTRKRA